jgi:hypothetical protein
MIHQDARTEFLKDMDRLLYKRTQLRLYRELSEIILHNSALHGNEQKALSFRGEIYRYSDPREPLPTPLNLCHRDLRDRLKAYITAWDTYERERDLALGFFGKLLLDTTFKEDIRALLPDTIANRAFLGFFQSGPGKFTPEQIEQYKVTHAKYLALLKAKLLYNLCDTATL